MEMTAIANIRDVEVPLIGVKFQDIYLNVIASLNPSSIMDSKIDMRLMIVKLWGLFNLGSGDFMSSPLDHSRWRRAVSFGVHRSSGGLLRCRALLSILRVRGASCLTGFWQDHDLIVVEICVNHLWWHSGALN